MARHLSDERVPQSNPAGAAHVADVGVPLITDLQLALALIEAMRSGVAERLDVVSWGDYVASKQHAAAAAVAERK